jgi:hypothetical protein
LLKDFPHLIELSAKGCDLTRLPERIGTSLRRLERLRLSDNKIVLDAAAVERLRTLTYLEVLKLDDNRWAVAEPVTHAQAQGGGPEEHRADRLA